MASDGRQGDGAWRALATLPEVITAVTDSLTEEVRRGAGELDGGLARVDAVLNELRTARDPLPALEQLAVAVAALQRTTLAMAGETHLLGEAVAEIHGSIIGIAALLRAAGERAATPSTSSIR